MSVANRQPKLTTKETKKQKRKTIFSTTVSGSWYLLQVKHFPGDTSSLQLFGRFHPLERSRTPFFPKPVLDTNLDMLCLVRGFIGESVGEIWFMLIYVHSKSSSVSTVYLSTFLKHGACRGHVSRVTRSLAKRHPIMPHIEIILSLEQVDTLVYM